MPLKSVKSPYKKRHNPTQNEHDVARIMARQVISTYALDHEVWDDAVEDAVLVVQVLALLTHALLARAERAKVLDRLGHGLAVEAHDDAALGHASDGHIEVHLVGDGGALAGSFGTQQSHRSAQRQRQRHDQLPRGHWIRIAEWNEGLSSLSLFDRSFG